MLNKIETIDLVVIGSLRIYREQIAKTIIPVENPKKRNVQL